MTPEEIDAIDRGIRQLGLRRVAGAAKVAVEAMMVEDWLLAAIAFLDLAAGARTMETDGVARWMVEQAYRQAVSTGEGLDGMLDTGMSDARLRLEAQLDAMHASWAANDDWYETVRRMLGEP